MHYRHWVRRNRGKNLKYARMLRISGVKVNLYVIWKIWGKNRVTITIALHIWQGNPIFLRGKKKFSFFESQSWKICDGMGRWLT